MNDCISILIIDDNDEFCKLLRENLEAEEDFSVVGTAGDGVMALKLIGELEPDVALLDIIMPNLDGLGVLERSFYTKPEKRPIFIIFTAIGGDGVIQNAVELGADYYIVKPFDVSVLITRIRQLYEEKSQAAALKNQCGDTEQNGVMYSSSNNLEKIVADLIKSMGVTPQLAGYCYLREAVMMGVEQPEKLKSVSRRIYQQIAANHNTNTRTIDRAIRCAIDSANRKIKNAGGIDRESIMIINGNSKPKYTQIISFLTERAIRKLAQK